MFPPFIRFLSLRFVQFLGYMSFTLKVKYEGFSPSNRMGCFFNMKKAVRPMGHLGFSYVGLIFLLMLFIPNILWAKNKPEEYSPDGENKVLLAFERAGEILATAFALIFDDFNFHGWTTWTWWLILAFAFMVMYILWWVRYFRSKKELQDFYSGFLGIPVAGATLPVIAFFLLGIYGKVIWMLAAAVILGMGHIGIHLQHKRELNI